MSDLTCILLLLGLTLTLICIIYLPTLHIHMHNQTAIKEKYEKKSKKYLRRKNKKLSKSVKKSITDLTVFSKEETKLIYRSYAANYKLVNISLYRYSLLPMASSIINILSLPAATDFYTKVAFSVSFFISLVCFMLSIILQDKIIPPDLRLISNYIILLRRINKYAKHKSVIEFDLVRDNILSIYNYLSRVRNTKINDSIYNIPQTTYINSIMLPIRQSYMKDERIINLESLKMGLLKSLSLFMFGIDIMSIHETNQNINRKPFIFNWSVILLMIILIIVIASLIADNENITVIIGVTASLVTVLSFIITMAKERKDYK